MKQSEINAWIALVLSAGASYYVWYISPVKDLPALFGVEMQIFWWFLWSTLVGAGFATLMLNSAAAVNADARPPS